MHRLEVIDMTSRFLTDMSIGRVWLPVGFLG
jgi:hypothetical protein